MLFTSSSVVTVLLCVLYLVNGQPTLETPSFQCCDRSLSLTCLQTGFTGTGFFWKKDSTPIYNDGGDTSGTGRYSQTSTANSFTLAISGALSDDGETFACNYNFQDSNSVTLQLYCPPTDNGTSVTRNDEKKLVIDISHIYPNTATVTVKKDTISLPGTTGTPTANGDYFDIQWISTDIIDDGLHAFKITVVTRTTTTVIDKEAIFGDCKLWICFIGLIVTIALCGGKLCLYFFNILEFKCIRSIEFGVKIVSPAAVICLVGILLAILLCLLSSGCDDDKGWATGVNAVLVIVCPCGSVGIIIVHFKFTDDKDETTGEKTQEHAGNDGGSSCFPRNNSILPICAGTDQQPQPSQGGQGQGGQHTAKGQTKLPPDHGKDDGLQKSNEAFQVKPRILPDIPPGGEKNIRGISANFDEVVPNKNRLTPIGKESIEIFEEKSPGKKKKKKKKDKGKDTSVE